MSEQCISQKFISYDALPDWLAELAKSATVYAPQKEGASVVYRPYKAGAALELQERPTESAKHTMFPRSESLFTFKKTGEPENPSNRATTVAEPAEPGPAVVFGAPSCDVRGFFAFDPVYNGSGTGGIAKDVYYLKRRSQTTLIARTCKYALVTCFCHWVGGGPASAQGADVHATDVEGGLVLRAMTDMGKTLLETGKLSDASAVQATAADTAIEQAEKSMDDAPDISGAPAALLSLFENADFWTNQIVGRCLSCRACTFLCPTCYCFNITDESNGITGTRLRNWDSCMSAHFTREASGHNPRNTRADRMRNRVGHKFSYYPNLHDGRFSCCGCGRCIKSCPSSVDIRKIVLNAIKEASNV